MEAWFNATGTPTGDWWSGITVAGWNNTYAVWQLAGISNSAINSSHLYYRVGVNSTWNAWKALASLDDNVASATKLLTTRTLWGQSFNGTQNVSGSLTGVANISINGYINNKLKVEDTSDWSTLKFGGTHNVAFGGFNEGYAHRGYCFRPAAGPQGYTTCDVYIQNGLTDGSSFDTRHAFYSNGRAVHVDYVQGTRFISTVGTGTAPLTVASTTQVANLNVSYLEGMKTNVNAVANTIVIRNGSNYAYFNYINSNTAEAENPTIGQFIVINTAHDGFYRKASMAHVKASLNRVQAYSLDLRSLDANTWYPCTMVLTSNMLTEIAIWVSLGGNKPTWATHASGFTLNLRWTVAGSGWGTTNVQRTILNSMFQYAASNPCGGIEQNTMESREIVYLRGGALYYYNTNDGRQFTINSSGYSWTSGSYSYSAPTRTSVKANPLDCYSASVLGVSDIRTSNLGVGYSATVGTTLTVTGATTLKSTLSVGSWLSVASSAAIAGSLDVSGATTLSSTLSVSSTSTLNGIVFAKAGLVANNGTSISGWSGAGVFAGASTYPLVIYGGNGNANTRQYYFSVSGNSLNFSSANDSNAYVTKIVEFRHAGTVFWPHAQYYNNRLIIANDGKITPQSTNTRRSGMYGIYDSTKIGHIWSIGASYMIPDDGATFGNLYGLAYKHTNNSTGGTMAGGHQMVWCENGVPKSAMGTSGVWSVGYVNSATLNVSSTSTFTGQITANGGLYGDLTKTNPQLAAGYENNEITAVNNSGINSLNHAIRFRWYANVYQIGIVRGGSSDDLGFAICRDTTPIARFQASRVTVTGDVYTSGSMVATSYIRTNSFISAGESADDSYGYINVTRPNNINNACCFSMVRSGTTPFGIGFDTSNRIVMGLAKNDKTIIPWISMSGSVTGVSNGFECSYIAVRGTTEASSGGGSITTSGGIWASKSIFSGGAITAKYTSDKNLKCDFNYSVDYRQKIMDLGDVVDFRYNNLALQRNKGAVDTKRHTGVIYQKAVKAGITGLCLPKDEDGFGSVNPLSSDLIFTVIGAMQATIRSTRSFESRFERMERELREAKEEIVRLRQEVFRRA